MDTPSLSQSSEKKGCVEDYIGKKFKLDTSENFDDYLKFIEIGYLQRMTASSVSPVAVLKKNDDGSYSFSMSSTFRTVTFTFREGEEFREERADGVKVKSLVTFEGNTMTQVQTEDNGRVSRHVRVFTPERLVVTTTAEGWDGKCVRTYKRV